MTTSLTLRNTKGSALTHTEMDANLTNLRTTADDALAAADTLTADKAEATALGVANTDQNMGTFTGTTIADNVSAKVGMQSLETAVETKANATAVGVTSSAANMGTYTGSTISDNQTAKQNIQQLETSLEGMGFNVKAFGAVGDGVTDDLAAINAAITALGAFGTGTSQDGGLIYFPPGIYYVSATIDLTGKHGVVFEGAGPLASEIKSTGNYPVITINGSSTDVTNKVGFRNLLIRGGGKASLSAHGISAKWTNRCFAENILFFGCRNCLDIYHAWQFKLDNCSAHGGGADQSYNFLYQGESTLANIDNAVIATGCYGQDCQNAGFRIINGQGSKYTSCEAGACAYGWHIGAPTTGTVACQWLHFTNCLGDSCTTRNWYFDIGTATALGEMIIEGTWTGNSAVGVASFEINTGTDIDINGLIAIVSDREAIKLVGCSRVGVSAVVTRQHNNANGGYGAIKLEDTSDCVVTGVKSYSTNADISVIETGTANNNILTSLSNIPTIVGASSKFSNVNNEVAFEYRNGAGSVGALIPAAGSSAYLGFGTTANRLLHYIERSSGGRLNFGTNSVARFFVGNGSGASEFLAGFAVPVGLWADTVANVTAIASPAGSIAYCTNGRKNGEGAGAGTGVLVFRDATAWRACDTGATVAA